MVAQKNDGSCTCEPPEDMVFGSTKKILFGCGSLFVTINEENGRPCQLLANIGKAGCCQRALLEAVCRLVNHLLDIDESLENIVKVLVGIRCDKGMAGVGRLSCVDALANQLKRYIVEEIPT